MLLTGAELSVRENNSAPMMLEAVGTFPPEVVESKDQQNLVQLRSCVSDSNTVAIVTLDPLQKAPADDKAFIGVIGSVPILIPPFGTQTAPIQLWTLTSAVFWLRSYEKSITAISDPFPCTS
jgi:hypothetical protein